MVPMRILVYYQDEIDLKLIIWIVHSYMRFLEKHFTIYFYEWQGSDQRLRSRLELPFPQGVTLVLPAYASRETSASGWIPMPYCRRQRQIPEVIYHFSRQEIKL